jgi:hypothetical protein
MAAIELEVDLATLLARIRASQGALIKGVDRGFRQAAAWGARDAKENAPVSTGQLKRQIASKVTRQGTAFRLEVGVGVPGTKGEPLVYARIQDVGGIVKPKKAKMLAFPVHKKLKTKKAKVSGLRARDVIEGIKTGSPSGFGFTSYSFTKRAIMGWRPIGGKGKMRGEVLFARASSVYIQATKYLTIPRRQLEGGRLRDFIAKNVQDEINKQLMKGNP